MNLKYKLEYYLLRACVALVNLLPLPVINGVTKCLAWLVWIIYPFRIAVAYDNISTVFPDLPHSDKLLLIRKAYQQFLSAAGMILVIHRKSMTTLIENAQVSGLPYLDQALALQKGALLTTYHGCWFEAYFAWFSRGQRPTSLIYQQKSNPLCDAFFIRQRRRYGNNLEHIHSLEKLQTYEQALRLNRILIVSLDQNYTDNGTSVTFFNKKFTCARGAALLHLRTGAPVLTSVYYIKKGQLHIDIEPVALPNYEGISDNHIQDISNRAIKGYEKTIRQYPDQWFSLFHRLWKKNGYPDHIERTWADIVRKEH